MFTGLSDLRKALIFYAIVLILVTGLMLLPLGESVALIAMFTPTLAVLLMLLVVTRDGYSRAGWASLGLHHAGLWTWPLAILGPLAVLGMSYLVIWTTGVATFAPPAEDATTLISGFGQGLFQNLVVVTLTFSLAEELGWRGYLLPRLAAALGDLRGMALTGLLHGAWHLPLILLTPYYHPDGNRWLIVPLFLATLTVAGLLYGYLRLATDSVWPASLAHSAHNYFWALFSSMTVAASPPAAEYLAGETGILPLVGYALVAAILLPRRRRERGERRVASAAPVPSQV